MTDPDRSTSTEFRTNTQQRHLQAGSGLLSVGPFLAAAALTLVAVLAGLSWVVALGMALMVGMAPVADNLGRRVLVGFVWIVWLFGVASLFPSLPTDGLGLSAMCLVSVMGATLLSWRRGWGRALPTVSAAEALVLVGGSLNLLILSLPLVGRGPELALLYVSRTWDNLPHFISVLAASGVDGFPRASGYNYGYHFIHALVLGVSPTEGAGGSAITVAGYAWTSIVLVSVCALALGFMALEVAVALSAADTGVRRWVVGGTGIAFLVCAPLSGLLASYLDWGHTNFLWAATAVTVASWLALSVGRGPRAWAFLVMGIVAAFTVYRSTQVGMASAAFIIVRSWADARSLPSWMSWSMAGSAALIVFAGWVPFHYYSGTSTVVGASVSQIGAGLAVPPTTVALGLLTALVLAWIALRRFGGEGGLMRLFAPVLGFVAFAGALTVEVLRTGNLADNYYIWKSASAAVIALFPAVIAGAVVAFAPRARTFSSRLGGVVGAGFVLLPWLTYPYSYDAWTATPSGVRFLDKRLGQLDLAPPSAGVLVAAERFGDARAAAVLVPYREWGWPSRPETATRWMNALRGTRSYGTFPAETCLRNDKQVFVEACLEHWRRENPETPLTIVKLGNATQRPRGQ